MDTIYLGEVKNHTLESNMLYAKRALKKHERNARLAKMATFLNSRRTLKKRHYVYLTTILSNEEILIMLEDYKKVLGAKVDTLKSNLSSYVKMMDMALEFYEIGMIVSKKRYKKFIEEFRKKYKGQLSEFYKEYPLIVSEVNKEISSMGIETFIEEMFGKN